jgi:nitrite reductase/ring-hydroxylating ferredoxin subunit
MPDQWTELQLLDDAEADVVIGARAGDHQLAAVLRDGRWRVFADLCTHAECAFTDYGEIAEDGALICNCHGAEFSLEDGAVLLEPAEEPLRLLDVREHEGQLQVRLGD